MSGRIDRPAAARFRFWLAQANREESSALLIAAGGDETKAIQRFAWAQNPEYTGKEALFARMSKAADTLAAVQRSGGDPMSEQIAEIKDASRAYESHRVESARLPPAPPIVLPNDPMQPVPDLRAMIAVGKEQLTPEYLAVMSAQGLTYKNTGGVIYVRHGETTHNANPGGVAGGSIRGPWGAQLTPGARTAASSLRGTMQALANQGMIASVDVSTVDRAADTYRLATQDVTGLPKPVFDRRHNEYRVGGFGNLAKIAPGNPKYVSKNGYWVGRDAQNQVAIDFNNMSRDWVPSSEPYLPNTPRFDGNPVRSQGDSESRNQHLARSEEVHDERALPVAGDGKFKVIFAHQFSGGNTSATIFRRGEDPMKTGHSIPNTAPQYWIVHVFVDAQGKEHGFAALAGRGDLAAPGETPKGQTPRANPASGGSAR